MTTHTSIILGKTYMLFGNNQRTSENFQGIGVVTRILDEGRTINGYNRCLVESDDDQQHDWCSVWVHVDDRIDVSQALIFPGAGFECHNADGKLAHFIKLDAITAYAIRDKQITPINTLLSEATVIGTIAIKTPGGAVHTFSNLK